MDINECIRQLATCCYFYCDSNKPMCDEQKCNAVKELYKTFNFNAEKELN